MERMLAVLPRTSRPASETPFYEFLACLHTNEPAPINLIQDGCSWSGPDLLTIIFDGLWVVMGAVANKHNLRMETEQEVWETVAPIVNRLVNLGLALTGTNIAAEQFQQEVLKPVLKKLNAQRNQTIENPSSLWTQEAMAFFAKLYKLGREKVEELNQLDRRINRQNIVVDRGTKAYVLHRGTLLPGKISQNWLISMLDPENHQHWTKDEPAYEDVLTEAERLTHERHLQKALATLPSGLIPSNKTISEERETRDEPTLELHAINTQLLLAANHQPVESNYIDSESYLPFLQTLKEKSNEECLTLFWQKLRQMGYTQDPPKALSELVHQRLKALKESKLSLSLHMGIEFFLKLDLKKGKHQYKDDVELEDAIRVLEHKKDEGKHKKFTIDNQTFTKHILNQTNWEAISEDVIVKVFEHVEDQTMMIRVLQKLSPEKRDPIISQLSHSDPELEQLCVREGWLTASKAKREQIAQEEHKRRFLELLARVSEQHKSGQTLKEADISNLFMHAFRMGNQGVRAAKINDPANRALFCHMLERIHTENFLPKALDDILPTILGKELHLYFILADEVEFRAAVYRDPPDLVPEQEEQCLTPWTLLAEEPQEISLHKQNIAVLHDLSPSKIRTFLRKHSEDEIFRWRYENEPEKLLETFVASRKAYYERKHQQGFKVPPEFAPSAPSPPKRKPAKRR